MSTPSPLKRSLAEYQQAIPRGIGRVSWAAAAAEPAACRKEWPSERVGWLAGSFAALLADQKDVALQLVEERLATDANDFQCLLQKAECLLALGRRDDAMATADV